MPTSDYRLFLFDALSGKLRVSSGRFLTIGSGETCTFRVEMKVRTGGTFAIRDDVCRFFPHGHVKDYSINGTHPGRDVRLRPSALYLMTLAGSCFLCWFGTRENMPDCSQYDVGKWYVYHLAGKTWSRAYTLPELCKLEPPPEPDSLVAFDGMSHSAFIAKDIMEASEFAGTLQRFQNTTEEPAEARPAPPMRCPFCWTSMEEGEILAIAAHPQLRGDSLLGENAMRRFKPAAFNRQGLPVDESGATCRGIACPHCHSKLPPFYSELRPHVISLVGARGVGKTYYQTTLVNEAARSFPHDFDAAFRDIAPELNAPLSRSRHRLFTASSPLQAFLEPTHRIPPHYNSIWKNGQFVKLPAPSLYGISRQGASCSILTYDNAGDDYEYETEEDAGLVTGHCDIASAIFFLFDPTQSASFKRLLVNGGNAHQDRNTARQTTLLNELELQLRLRFNQPTPAKLPIPIAFILGKSDAWRDLLGPEPLLPAVHQGRFMPSCVQANSKRLRQLLFNISPQFCLSAESLSDKVCYFAVSSFGKEPVAFDDEDTGERRFAPESGAIQPNHVTDPLLWALSLLEPHLLPKNT